MKDILLVFDIDWAPDAAIEFTAKILEKNQIRSTWFVTHPSPAVDYLRTNNDLFELGIHPNFLPNSTHGATEDEIIAHVQTLVPHAKVNRTHSYYQSSPLLKKLVEKTEIEADMSIFMPRVQNLQPFEYFIGGRVITRFPVFWEDDYEMKFTDNTWEVNTQAVLSPGLKVFAFHPIHVLLNSNLFDVYNQVKRSKKDFGQLTLSELLPAVNSASNGVRTFFENLLSLNNQEVNFLQVSYLLKKM